jgi:3-hydroxybutyryl-CoA dehydrogenase
MTREFTKVGVIGLGTMGAGIVEVFARNGIDVVAVEVDGPALERGKAVLGGSTGRARPAARSTQEDARRAARAGHLHEQPRGPRPLPTRRRGRARAHGPQEGTARQGRQVVAADAILATNTSSLPVTEIAVATQEPQARRRHALLQPRPGAAVRRGHPHRHHRRRRLRGRQGARGAAGKKPVVVGDKAGFIANALLFGYLNHAVSMFESRTPPARTSTPRCASAAVTRWARSRCSTSSASTRHTRSSTRCTSRAVTACTRRAPSSSRWSAQACSAARAVAGSTRMPAPARREVVADARPRLGSPPAGRRPAVGRVGVRRLGTMATGIIEVFAKAGYAVTFVARGDRQGRRGAGRPRPQQAR